MSGRGTEMRIEYALRGFVQRSIFQDSTHRIIRRKALLLHPIPVHRIRIKLCHQSCTRFPRALPLQDRVSRKPPITVGGARVKPGWRGRRVVQPFADDDEFGEEGGGVHDGLGECGGWRVWVRGEQFAGVGEFWGRRFSEAVAC